MLFGWLLKCCGGVVGLVVGLVVVGVVVGMLLGCCLWFVVVLWKGLWKCCWAVELGCCGAVLGCLAECGCCCCCCCVGVVGVLWAFNEVCWGVVVDVLLRVLWGLLGMLLGPKALNPSLETQSPKP